MVLFELIASEFDPDNSALDVTDSSTDEFGNLAISRNTSMTLFTALLFVFSFLQEEGLHYLLIFYLVDEAVIDVVTITIVLIAVAAVCQLSIFILLYT